MTQEGRCSVGLLNFLADNENSLSTSWGRPDPCFEYVLAAEGRQMLSSSNLLLIWTRISLPMRLDYVQHTKNTVWWLQLCHSLLCRFNQVCFNKLWLWSGTSHLVEEILYFIPQLAEPPNQGCPLEIPPPHAHKFSGKFWLILARLYCYTSINNQSFTIFHNTALFTNTAIDFDATQTEKMAMGCFGLNRNVRPR